jgi:UDP-N-acetylglucosamine:LPS N-acetylglucosamine transferase
VGAFSRFDGRSPPTVEPERDGRRRVLVLGGTGGGYYTSDELTASVAATPAWRWRVLGPGRDWVEDPWPHLVAADVVVTHAGQNALAEIAAARRPAIVIPAERPHGEQNATAAALSERHLALCCPRWPAAGDWARLLEAVAATDGRRWNVWAPGNGAVTAAAIVDRYAEQFGGRK